MVSFMLFSYVLMLCKIKKKKKLKLISEIECYGSEGVKKRNGNVENRERLRSEREGGERKEKVVNGS